MIGSRPIAAGVDEPATRLGRLPLGWPAGLTAILIVGALVRVAGLVSPGHGGDIYAFYIWAEDAARYGLGSYYESASGALANYPLMLYLLWPLGVALDTPLLEGAIRLLSIPFDLALGVLLFDVAARLTGRARDGLLAASFYVLNPAVLICGPIWGQVDGMGALPMVASVVAVARGRVAIGGSLAVLAGLVKPQFGIAGFVLAGLALFWLRERSGGSTRGGWSRAGWRRAVVLAVSAGLTFVAVLLPLGLLPLGYIELMDATFGQYPFISAFGFNPWGMLFGFNDEDGALALLGTVLAVAGILGSLWLLRRRRDLVGLLGVSVLIGLVIYYLPTRVHERYLFGAIAFLAPLTAVYPRLRWPFVLLSAGFFLTLAYVVASSPFRILPGPQLVEFPEWGITVMSAAMTAIGGWTAIRVLGLFRAARGGSE